MATWSPACAWRPRAWTSASTGATSSPGRGAAPPPASPDRSAAAENKQGQAGRRPTMAEAVVSVVMGSESDWETMRHTTRTLEDLAIPHETRVLSAHRTPDQLAEYVEGAEGRGIRVFIAAAGMAAALPGVVAAKTALPVLGVPLETRGGGGLGFVLSIV